jgi:hypothetical protein
MSFILWLACEKDRKKLLAELRLLVNAIEEIKGLKPEPADVKDWGSYDTDKLERMSLLIEEILDRYPKPPPYKGPYDHFGN